MATSNEAIFSSEEIKKLIEGDYSSSERKRKQNERKITNYTEISSENHTISATKFYGGQKRFRFLNEALSYIEETEEDARTVTMVMK